MAPTTTHRPSDWTVSKSSSSSCITGKHAGKGVCCYDTAIPSETSTTDTSSWIGIPTGCAEGFECAQEYINNAERSFCRKVDVNKTDAPDQVPRYRLCSLSVEALTRVYGLPVIPNPKLFQASRDYPQLAYVSTAGPLDSNDRTIRQRQAQTETILIVIHGSGRNVQDYLCAMTAAVPPPLRETTLVLAPWFRTPQDAPVSLYNRTDDMHPLQWAELGPIFHTWRYGADAINPVLVQHHKKVSSYAVLDTLLTQYVQQVQNERFPRLQRIIVAGHSAGGQYVHRWALLSNAPVWKALSIRVVVANPRSFCYLDDRRFVNGTFQKPDLHDCDWYNQWEWGLGPGKELDTPYKDRAIQEAGGVDAIVQRYPTRDVVYLSGEQDVYGTGEDDCQDQLQGAFRRERSEYYMASLQIIFGRPVHRRMVVPGVPHDHALMFQSVEGMHALFDSTSSVMIQHLQGRVTNEPRIVPNHMELTR